MIRVQNEIQCSGQRPLHRIEICCLASIGSAIIPVYQEDPSPQDEVCIPKAILAAQYGSAIIPAYQEDPNPQDEVCIPKAMLAAQYGCVINPAYHEDPIPETKSAYQKRF